MNNKEVYKVFCEKEKSLPLFLSYNWLEAIAPGKWNVVIETKDIEIVGVFPYIQSRENGFYFIRLPQYTAYAGIWLAYPPNQKPSTKLKFEKEVINNLIEKLPRFDYFNHSFYPTFQNWLPFYWKGFTQTTKYTYIIDNLSNHDEVYNCFSSTTRRDIKKAMDAGINISVATDIDLLYNLRFETYQKNGIKTRLSENIKSIYYASQKHNFGELIIAKDNNEIHAASFFVWDNNTCYYLFGASNPEHKNSGAMSLLLWEAMKKYSHKVKEFNFEGSMIENVERFFRGFGARQVPYFQIYKYNSRVLKIKDFLKNW